MDVGCALHGVSSAAIETILKPLVAAVRVSAYGVLTLPDVLILSFKLTSSCPILEKGHEYDSFSITNRLGQDLALFTRLYLCLWCL